MAGYLFKRLLLLIFTLFGVTLITFGMLQLAPGNPVMMKLRSGPGGQMSAENTASREIIEQTKKLYGLDKPLHVQYVNWIRRLVTLDLGDSLQDHRPVAAKLAEALPVSLLFGLTSTFLVYLVIIPSGILSAMREQGVEVRLMTVVYFLFYCVPSFWLGILGIVYLGGGDFWNVFPVFGLMSDEFQQQQCWDWPKFKDLLWHLVMPLACYTIGGFAFATRQLATSLKDTMAMDYVNTARAKGLPRRTVVIKHALRNALIPMVTLFAGFLPGLFAASVLVERIFSIPGLGLLLFESLQARDYPVIMAGTTFTAILVLAGLLMSDLLYVVVDPRIDFESLEGG